MSSFLSGRNFGSKIQTADIADNATTNVKMADDAIGVAELSATGTPSSSNFLRGDNAWAEAGGGWNFVSRTTCSSTSDVSYTNLTTGYDYQVVVTNILFGTQGDLVTALVGVSGPTYRTSGYFSADYRIDSAGNSGGVKRTASFNPMHTSATSSATGESYFIFTLFDPANASTETYANYDGVTVNSELTYYRVTGGGKYGTAEANVALKFLPGSGNIATGFFDLYKRKNA